MSSFTTITLDTTAPVVDYGVIAGASAGQLLQIAYISDEPIAAATLELSDSRVLSVTINPSSLEVLLPGDTPSGVAQLVVLDDVGNAAAPYPVALTLATSRVRPSGAQAIRPTRSTGPSRIIFLEARAGMRSHTSVARTAAGATTTGRSRRSAAVHGASRGVVRLGSAQLTRGTAAATAISASAHAQVRLGVTRRRDGPDIEESLLLDLW